MSKFLYHLLLQAVRKEGRHLMAGKLTLIFVCSAIVYLAMLGIAIPVLAQTTQTFQYVIPRFTGNAGSELIISNLSSVPANPEVTFRDSIQGLVADTTITISAGTQQRLTASSFSLSSFQGSVVVASSAPLSVIATLAAAGGFESVAPAASSADLIVPISQGTTGSMRLTIFNPDNRQTSVVIVPVATNGSAVGGAQLAVAALGTLTADIASLFPQSSGSPQDISHVLIHVPTTILGPQHQVFAQAGMFSFSDPAEGIAVPHADFSEVTAVPVSAAALSGMFPFFVQGGDYVTELQFINPGSNAGSVTLTARGLDGNVVPGTAATSIVVPATGAVRHSVQRIFNLGAGITVGSVVFQSTMPVVAAEAIASVSQSGFVVLPVGPQANTNFVFSVRDSNPQSFLGLALLNPSASPANLTLQYISDAGAAVASTTLTINPSTEAARTLADLLPNARNAGFIYITSNVPIIATALEGALDNSILGALPPMHSQPDYPGPTSTASPAPPPPPSGFGSAAPVLASFGALPAPLIAGNPGFTTTITGTGFLSGVSALVNGVPVPTTLVSPTVIQVTIPPEDLAVGTILKVSAINPAPTIASSNSLDLPVSNPVPVVLTISPNNAEVRLEPNAPPLAIAVTGFGFKPGAVITVNGATIPTTFQSATSLAGSIPQASLLVGGTFPVSVVNPAPSIGPAGSMPLYLANLLPILTSVDAGQMSFDANRPAETFPAPVILRGSNFSTASVFELSNLCTVAGLAISPSTATVLTGTTQQFTAYLNGKATSAVTWSVNNVPGGDLTNGMITATGLYTAPAAPPSGGIVTVTAASTTSSTFATATVTITSNASTTGGVTGVGAVGASVVSSHEAVLTVTVSCAGQYSVRVRNPQPGGGISQTLSFNVLAFTPVSTPSVTSLSPNSITAGSPSFTLTITGSNFHTGAVVSFGSAVLFPAVVTSASITVTVPSYLITQSDVIPIVVTNPDATGSSNRILFTVN